MSEGTPPLPPGPRVVNLDNIDTERPIKGILNSPRSIDVCLKNGIRLEELVARPLESFSEVGISKEIVSLRAVHFETRRQEKLKFLRGERRELLRHVADQIDDLRRQLDLVHHSSPSRSSSSPRASSPSPYARTASPTIFATRTPHDEVMRRKSEEMASKHAARREVTHKNLMAQEMQLKRRNEQLLEKDRTRTETAGSAKERQVKAVTSRKEAHQQHLSTVAQKQRDIAELHHLRAEERRKREMEKLKLCNATRQKHLEETRNRAHETTTRLTEVQMRNRQNDVHRMERAAQFESKDRTAVVEARRAVVLKQKKETQAERDARRQQALLRTERERQQRHAVLVDAQLGKEERAMKRKTADRNAQELHFEKARLTWADRRENVERVQRKQEYEAMRRLMRYEAKMEGLPASALQLYDGQVPRLSFDGTHRLSDERTSSSPRRARSATPTSRRKSPPPSVQSARGPSQGMTLDPETEAQLRAELEAELAAAEQAVAQVEVEAARRLDEAAAEVQQASSGEEYSHPPTSSDVSGGEQPTPPRARDPGQPKWENVSPVYSL